MKLILYYVGKVCHLIHRTYRKLISLYLNSFYNRNIYTFDRNVYFNGISTITGLENIKMGVNVHIGNNAFIKGEGGLVIGDNTHISRNLVLYTQNHNYNGDLLPYNEEIIKKPVIIEKNVWIGMNVIILPGTHIREGAIIGAGSVVSGKVEKCSIYGASLAREIKSRNFNQYSKLEEKGKYGGVNGKPL